VKQGDTGSRRDKGGGCNKSLITAGEFLISIIGRWRTCLDRFVIQIAMDIRDERSDGYF